MAIERNVSVFPQRGSEDVAAMFAPPPASAGVPRFDQGWLESERRAPFLSYVGETSAANWSEELEALHEEASRTHFIDRWTRSAIVERVRGIRSPTAIADVGCSSGHLLDDLHAAFPQATLVGVDLIAAGLRRIHQRLPSALLLQADACSLPIADASFDAVVSANLLEHISDDRRALCEMARVVRPGGCAVIVVPAGPRTYDYYDRFLGHQRRYARGELAAKCREVGLEPFVDLHLAALLYPAFWLVKQRNRRRYAGLRGVALEARVAADIRGTRDAPAGELAWRLEDWLLRAGLQLPFGIRSLVAARRPEMAP